LWAITQVLASMNMKIVTSLSLDWIALC